MKSSLLKYEMHQIVGSKSENVHQIVGSELENVHQIVGSNVSLTIKRKHEVYRFSLSELATQNRIYLS